MKLDPRNLARVRTQVWFAATALQGMKTEAGTSVEGAVQAEEALGPIIRLLELAQVKLSDAIDDPLLVGQVRRPDAYPA
jgi:hypothetical protein